MRNPDAWRRLSARPRSETPRGQSGSRSGSRPEEAVIGTLEQAAWPETGAGGETLPERSRLTTQMEPTHQTIGEIMRSRRAAHLETLGCQAECRIDLTVRAAR